jgi:hypothetical protein
MGVLYLDGYTGRVQRAECAGGYLHQLSSISVIMKAFQGVMNTAQLRIIPPQISSHELPCILLRDPSTGTHKADAGLTTTSHVCGFLPGSIA